MNRKSYFKDMAIIYIVFIAMGIASLTAERGDTIIWNIVLPTFFFGTIVGVTLYGLIKYKK